jgi:type IV secretory pathway ATPase VirB11/archaellum biosynthesis ATPase
MNVRTSVVVKKAIYSSHKEAHTGQGCSSAAHAQSVHKVLDSVLNTTLKRSQGMLKNPFSMVRLRE